MLCFSELASLEKESGVMRETVTIHRILNYWSPSA
jgi:hypothetical protein